MDGWMDGWVDGWMQLSYYEIQLLGGLAIIKLL
jgi:hypothetical protein